MANEKPIECPMKIVEIFPWGKVFVPDIEELKKRMEESNER